MRSRRTAATTIALILTIMFSLSTRAATPVKYTIRFEEGAYTYDSSKPESAPENKYLAKVTVQRDGQTLATVRGSTLPNSYYFYVGWHRDGRVAAPTDEDVAKVMADLKGQVDGLRSGSAQPNDSFG
jgi:hypothetical protein